MIPAKFAYRRASSLDEAIQLLQESKGEAKLLAGGHSLIPLMKLRLSEPAMLIDIGRIQELRGIRERDGEIEIGALTTHYELQTSPLLRERAPVVSETAAEIGDVQVRHRGTIGGSLAHADPAADLPAVMVALDAELHLRGPNGWRAVRAEEFFQDLFTVDLAEDEVLVAIRFRPLRTAAYAKLHQRASHYALVGVCAALELDGGAIRQARVAVTGVSTHAQRLPNVEQLLVGKPATQETIDAAAAVAGDTLEFVNSDIHGSEEYRRAMTKVFPRRALERAISR